MQTGFAPREVPGEGSAGEQNPTCAAAHCCCQDLRGWAGWEQQESSGQYISNGWMRKVGGSLVGGLQIMPDFTSLSNVDCINARGTGLRSAQPS